RQIKKRVGIEAIDKIVTVVIQVALNLELAKKIELAVPCGEPAPEFCVHRFVGKKGNMPDTAGQSQAVLGIVLVFSLAPGWIVEYCPAGDGVERNSLRGGPRGRGQHNGRGNVFRILGCPL